MVKRFAGKLAFCLRLFLLVRSVGTLLISNKMQPTLRWRIFPQYHNTQYSMYSRQKFNFLFWNLAFIWYRVKKLNSLCFATEELSDFLIASKHLHIYTADQLATHTHRSLTHTHTHSIRENCQRFTHTHTHNGKTDNWQFYSFIVFVPFDFDTLLISE